MAINGAMRYREKVEIEPISQTSEPREPVEQSKRGNDVIRTMKKKRERE